MSKRYAETENPQYHRTYNELTSVSQIFLLPKMVELSSVSEKSIQGILQELESKADRCSNLLQSVTKEIEKTPDNPELIRHKLQREARQDVLSAEINFAHELILKKRGVNIVDQDIYHEKETAKISDKGNGSSQENCPKPILKTVTARELEGMEFPANENEVEFNFDIEEMLLAITMLQQKGDKFTLAELAQLIYPDIGSHQLHKSREYSRIYREINKLIETGYIIINAFKSVSKPNTKFYSVAHGKDLADVHKKEDSIKLSPPVSAAQMIEDPDFGLCEAAGEANPLRPILLEDVLSNLEIICRERNSAVGSDDLRQRFYPANNDGKVSSILKYLVDTGKVLRTKVKQKYFYHPHWMTVNPIQPEHEPMPPIKGVPKKVLAFQCEVCASLIGIKALDSLQIINCNGCQSKYLIDRRNAFRMNPAINLEVWSPIPNQIL